MQKLMKYITALFGGFFLLMEEIELWKRRI